MRDQAVIKALLITVALLTGIVFGLIAGIVSAAAGSSIPTAAGTGIGMFFVASTVAIGIMTFARN
jgi:hypothetical protein